MLNNELQSSFTAKLVDIEAIDHMDTILSEGVAGLIERDRIEILPGTRAAQDEFQVVFTHYTTTDDLEFAVKQFQAVRDQLGLKA